MPSTPARSICVFCGSQSGSKPDYKRLAEDVGRLIAQKNYRLIYGGGGSGLMGATARAAHKAGGDILGIIPKFLTEIEALLEDVPHEIVADMHVRKAKMYEAGDAFIVLPGGIGTLEEAVEVMSWLRMRLHSKPIVFVSPDGFWQALIDVFLQTIDAGFAPEWLREETLMAETAPQAMALIEEHWAKADANTPPSSKFSADLF